jgi:hypothetical protein
MEVFGQCAVLKHGKLNKKKLEISIWVFLNIFVFVVAAASF